MKKYIMLMAIWMQAALVQSADLNLEDFGNVYFSAWKATQAPGATQSDIKNYLKLLKDNVGHQHLPYDPVADRAPDGKSRMMEGMTYYLGVHQEYEAELLMILTDFNVVAIQYRTYSKGIHPQTGKEIVSRNTTLEVLEMEDGMVGVIRKYSD